MHSISQDKPVRLPLSKTDSGEEFPRPTVETFHAIFVRYSKSVLSFIYSMIRDRSHAEELCQETFIRAFRKLDSKSKDTSLSTWLFGIANNVVREAVKRKYRNLRQAAPMDPLAEQADTAAARPDQQLISAELHGRIRSALWMLTESQRLVFILKIIHQLKYEEIAHITGASITKLKTDLHRARMEMRQNLHQYLSGDSTRM